MVEGNENLKADYKFPKNCRDCKYCLPETNSLFECKKNFPCFKKDSDK